MRRSHSSQLRQMS